MVRITEALVRSRAEHNDGMVGSLEEVSLHQYEIEKIEFLNQHCRKLKIIYLQNNLIQKIENVNRLSELEYLNLALNNISCIENLSDCENLNKLDLTVNFIDLDTMEQSLRHLGECHCLRELYMTGNPCTNFEGYRKLVVALVPKLTTLDGEEIFPSERIEARQDLKRLLELLREAAVDRIQERASTTNTNDESTYTSENRLKMYREIAKEKEDKEIQKKAHSASLMHDPMADPFREAQKRMSEKASVSADGTLPKQRNQGQWAFSITEDKKGNVVVDVSLEKFLATSLIDVDVHPRWFQLKIKDRLLLLHLPEEVKSDLTKVQRIQANGHLVLTMPRVFYEPLKRTTAPEIRSGLISINQSYASRQELQRSLSAAKQYVIPSNSSAASSALNGDFTKLDRSEALLDFDEADVPPLE